MDLSIIVPIYNVEKYLDECIESALQIKADLEIILVDDGSTDNSGSLCDKWAETEPRIKVIHQKNGGLSAARNAGIQNSRGEFIMFLDSDDLLDPVETERMLAELDEKVDVMMGLYREFYSDSREYQNENSPAFLKMRGDTPINDFLSTLPIDGNSCYMIACRFICRRSFLLENDLFFMTGIYHEDEEFSQRLFYYAKSIYVTHSYFYLYRQARKDSITASVNPKRIYDRFIIIQKGAELLESPQTSMALKDYLRKQLALVYFANLSDYHILSREEKKPIWSKYKKFRYLSGYQNNKLGKLIFLMQKLMGLKLVCYLLPCLYKLKKAVS